MCNILGLSYVGAKEELRQRITRALVNIRTLVSYSKMSYSKEALNELMTQKISEQMTK